MNISKSCSKWVVVILLHYSRFCRRTFAKPRTEPVRVHILVEKRIAPTTFDPVWGRTIWRGAIISFYQYFVPNRTFDQYCTVMTNCIHRKALRAFSSHFHLRDVSFRLRGTKQEESNPCVKRSLMPFGLVFLKNSTAY